MRNRTDTALVGYFFGGGSLISLIEKRDIHWLRLSAINLIVFIVILGLIEIAARTIFDQETEPGLEAFITSRPPPFHKDTSFEEVVKQFNNSCNYPSPEIVLHEGLPTYTQDFAKNVKLLIEKEQTGLFNMVCSGYTSRLEVCKELVRLMGLEHKIEIKQVPSDYFSKEYFVKRPDCERLINKHLDDLGLNIMREWRITLKEYLNDYYEELIYKT